MSTTRRVSRWPDGHRRHAYGFAAALLGTLLLSSACGRSDADAAHGPSMTPAPASAPTTPVVDDDALAMRYLELRAGYDQAPESFGGKPGSPELTAITSELRAMSNEARDVHLRANAALLLGAMHQARGGWAEAAGSYRRAAQLVPDDAGPHMALARALSETKDYKAGAEAQLRAALLDPDNLEQYLALGELRIKAGDKDGGAKAYADYEVRRRGLIDGLTLKHEGAYTVSAEDRIGCAESLAVAADVGTAFALLYALDQDPDPKVRAAIVRAMGSHRFVGYKPRLVKRLADERDDDVRAAITWAIAEIDRAPVDTRLDGPPPTETPPPPAAPVPSPTGATPAAVSPAAAVPAPAPTPASAPVPAAGVGSGGADGVIDPPAP